MERAISYGMVPVITVAVETMQDCIQTVGGIASVAGRTGEKTGSMTPLDQSKGKLQWVNLL